MSLKRTFPVAFLDFIKLNKFLLLLLVFFGVLALSPVKALAAYQDDMYSLQLPDSSEDIKLHVLYNNRCDFYEKSGSVGNVYKFKADIIYVINSSKYYVSGGCGITVPFTFNVENLSPSHYTVSSIVFENGSNYFFNDYVSGSSLFSPGNRKLTSRFLIKNYKGTDCLVCKASIYFTVTLSREFIEDNFPVNFYYSISTGTPTVSYTNFIYSINPLAGDSTTNSILNALQIWDDPLMDQLYDIDTKIQAFYNRNHTDMVSVYNRINALIDSNHSDLQDILNYLQERDEELADGAAEVASEAADDLLDADDGLDQTQEAILAELNIDDIELDQLSDNPVTILQQNQQTTGFWVGLVRSFADNAGIIWTFVIIGVTLSVLVFILRL